MNTINVDLSTGEALNLPIGRQGENNVTQVIFDFSALKTEFGSGTLSLSVKRPKEYVPYAQTMTISGTNATWLVNETDTGNFGCGEIQLTYTVSGKVAKTVIYKYTVLRSIGADGEYPIPGQTWQEEIEDDIAEIKEDLAALEGGGMSDDVKSALLQIAQKVVYVDDGGQTYYQDLYDALYPPAPPATLSYITCVYTQSGTVYDTDTLNSLKSDLVVTAHWSNSTTTTVPSADYTLSGTLTEGTSTVTVSYGGKTTTFNVTVSASKLPSGYTEYDYVKLTKEGGQSGYGIIAAVPNGTDYTFDTTVLYTKADVNYAVPIFGTRTSGVSQKEFALFFTPSTAKLGYWYWGTDTSQSFNPLVVNTKLNIKVQPVGVSSLYPSNVTINVNGTDYNTGSTATGQTFAQYLGLFNYASSATGFGGSPQYIGTQIGETIITDANNDVIADLVPCFNGSVYGFYDAVGKEFYYDSNHPADYTGGTWEV